MVEPGGGPASGGGAPENGTRVLAITAGLAAVLAFVVAIGLLIRSNQDTEDVPTPSTTLTSLAETVTVRSTESPAPTRPSISAPNTSPLPTQPAHRVGDDCSVDGGAGRWDVVTGRGWVCVPATTAPATPGGP
ncbi:MULTISPECIES: hypothetical protein [Nocardia]|uniref:hypothetical protein n=1 Tax=Nocardia TaxID=1817 RepID=UPI000D69E4AB|nr:MULTISPECIES: hypothetical protein [Nocardia]